MGQARAAARGRAERHAARRRATRPKKRPACGRAVVRCQFMYRPEYVAPGTILLFREGRAKGVGRIKKVFANKSPTEKSLKAAQHEQARREKMAPKQG